jgi:hypothetical protein
MRRWGFNVTLFCCRALARCLAPSLLISLSSRSSLLNVCQLDSQWDKEKMRKMLPNCVVKQLQDVQLPCHQLYSSEDKVWWVSVWNSEWVVKWEGGIEHYFVLLWSIGKILSSLGTNQIISQVKCNECLCKLDGEWGDKKVQGSYSVLL